MKRRYILKHESELIRLKNEQTVFRKVYLKYLIIRVRIKISFIALQKRMTILELFVSTIMKTYLHLMRSGHIPALSEEMIQKHNSTFLKLITRGYKGCVVTIFEYNLDNHNGRDLSWLKLRMKALKKR